MLGRELRALQRADGAVAEEGVHLGAEVAQPQAGIARRAAGATNSGITSSSAGIVVVQPLEGDQRAQQRAGLARFDAGRQQEQQRIEVVLLRHDPVLAQILGDHRRRNAAVGIGAGGAVEAGRQQGQLVGIGDGIARRDMAEAVPARRRARAPSSAGRRRARRSATCSHAISRAVAACATAIGHEGIEEPAPCRIALSLSSNSRRIARIFLRSSMPSRTVSSHSTSPDLPFIICAPTSSEANSG